MKWKYRTHINVRCHTGLTQYSTGDCGTQPTSSTGTVALHRTDCIHFLIICCISLMDGILKRSFSNLVPWGTNKTEAYYSRPRPRPRHQSSRPRQWKFAPRGSLEVSLRLPRGEAVPQGTTSLEAAWVHKNTLLTWHATWFQDLPMCKVWEQNKAFMHQFKPITHKSTKVISSSLQPQCRAKYVSK